LSLFFSFTRLLILIETQTLTCILIFTEKENKTYQTFTLTRHFDTSKLKQKWWTQISLKRHFRFPSNYAVVITLNLCWEFAFPHLSKDLSAWDNPSSNVRKNYHVVDLINTYLDIQENSPRESPSICSNATWMLLLVPNFA